MIKRSIFPAVLILLFTPNLAQAFSLAVDHCQMIHIGLVSIVFGLASGYATRTAGSPFFRSLFKVNAGSYIFSFIFFGHQLMQYGGPPCVTSELFVFVLVMPLLALAQVIALANAARKARKEASGETEGPGAMRLGFSSAGLLLGALAIFFFTYSSEERSRRPYDSDVKANLHNYFLACKAYWGDVGGDNTCSLEIAQRASYGFYQSTRVEIMTETGNESSFTAFATHQKSDSVFQMNHEGNIEVSVDSPFPPPPPPKTRWELFLKNIGVSETVPAG